MESLGALDPNFLGAPEEIFGASEPHYNNLSTVIMEWYQKVDEYVSSSPSAFESARCFLSDILPWPWLKRV
jgi:hypothetical protein